MDQSIPAARPRPGNILARSLFFAATGRITPAKGMEAVFNALADPTRRRVLEKLSRGGTVTATGLASRLPISRQAVSKHLETLHEAELVDSDRVGRETRYSLKPESFDGAAMWIQTVSAEWDDRLEAIRRTLERRRRASDTDSADENAA
jgi:DNA-binding transcriptional ArsR family regulator